MVNLCTKLNIFFLLSIEQAEKLAQEVKLQMEYEHQKKLEQEQRERSGGRRSKRHSDPKSIIPFGKSAISIFKTPK